MGKEVDVKVDWEVDEVGEDVPIFRMNKNVFLFDCFPWPSFLDQKNLARKAQKCHLLGSVSLHVKNQSLS